MTSDADNADEGADVPAHQDRAKQHSSARPSSQGWELDGAADDACLLAAIRQGDQVSLARLYDRRAGALFSMLVRMLNQDAEAEECLQDTFLRIWQRAETYDPARSAPFTWMVMIARGLALSRLRARGSALQARSAYESEVASLEIEHIDPAWHPPDSELNTACSRALRGLPDEQRRAVELAFFRGWTHAEIAEATGEPLGTIKARIRRGLLALRGFLEDFHA
ncbi:MAG: sigma-70 family RNA polymerase sigma factor [Verrucomicrobiales bacterium]|nr:sigma-70 family RNA polymerase sigma factor [Verrucomicrobiales bacterium]